MADVAYRSEVVIDRMAGGLRRAHLPAEKEPVTFGVHGAIAAHYGKAEGSHEAHAATLDYIVAATGG